MDRPFECPECGSAHDEPAEANVSLFARCLDCELEALYRADRDVGFEVAARAA